MTEQERDVDADAFDEQWIKDMYELRLEGWRWDIVRAYRMAYFYWKIIPPVVIVFSGLVALLVALRRRENWRWIATAAPLLFSVIWMRGLRASRTEAHVAFMGCSGHGSIRPIGGSPLS